MYCFYLHKYLSLWSIGCLYWYFLWFNIIFQLCVLMLPVCIPHFLCSAFFHLFICFWFRWFHYCYYYYYYWTKRTKWRRTSANAIRHRNQPPRTLNVDTERQNEKEMFGEGWEKRRDTIQMYTKCRRCVHRIKHIRKSYITKTIGNE